MGSIITIIIIIIIIIVGSLSTYSQMSLRHTTFNSFILKLTRKQANKNDIKTHTIINSVCFDVIVIGLCIINTINNIYIHKFVGLCIINTINNIYTQICHHLLQYNIIHTHTHTHTHNIPS